MAVKIVHGVAGGSGSEPSTSAASTSGAQSTQTVSSSAVQQTAAVISRVVATTDAAVTAVRSLKQPAPTERLKDYKEAREVAYDVADRVVVDREEATEAHSSLESTSAREHFR